jgi:hypothetical protein
MRDSSARNGADGSASTITDAGKAEVERE